MTLAQLQALKTEVQTDPSALGYVTPLNGGDLDAIATILNTRRAAISLKRPDIGSKEIFEAIDMADCTKLSGTPNATQLSAERCYLAWLTALPIIPTVRLLNDDGTDGPVIANLKAIFPVSSTRTRLAALSTRNGSRAEQLFGINVTISHDDVAAALRT